jgi:hypothetical protein
VVIDPHAGYRRRPSGLPEALIAVGHSHLITLENKRSRPSGSRRRKNNAFSRVGPGQVIEVVVERVDVR